jgi:1-acyl-sn-glycerol-3-phosphate acyltransferase
VLRPFYKFFFEQAGWTIKGSIALELDKYVMIVAPHTSNKDFLVGLAARSILKLKTKYLAKKELFRFPFGIIFRLWGGYPVDRKKHANMVDAVAKIFNDHTRFSICITPEGTRKYVPEWKTGFYRIAEKLNIPVVMVGFDYKKKEVSIEPPFYTSGNIEQDIELMKKHYRKITGKIPENGVR